MTHHLVERDGPRRILRATVEGDRRAALDLKRQMEREAAQTGRTVHLLVVEDIVMYTSRVVEQLGATSVMHGRGLLYVEEYGSAGVPDQMADLGWVRGNGPCMWVFGIGHRAPVATPVDCGVYNSEEREDRAYRRATLWAERERCERAMADASRRMAEIDRLLAG